MEMNESLEVQDDIERVNLLDDPRTDRDLRHHWSLREGEPPNGQLSFFGGYCNLIVEGNESILAGGTVRVLGIYHAQRGDPTTVIVTSGLDNAVVDVDSRYTCDHSRRNTSKLSSQEASWREPKLLQPNIPGSWESIDQLQEIHDQKPYLPRMHSSQRSRQVLRAREVRPHPLDEEVFTFGVHPQSVRKVTRRKRAKMAMCIVAALLGSLMGVDGIQKLRGSPMILSAREILAWIIWVVVISIWGIELTYTNNRTWDSVFSQDNITQFLQRLPPPSFVIPGVASVIRVRQASYAESTTHKRGAHARMIKMGSMYEIT
ncbi:hypothetical protein DICA1_E21462 [Diutina catenulata]